MEPTLDDKPWSIPVREPGPDVPHRAATWVDRLPVLPTVLSGVALVALLIGALVVLDAGTARSGPEVAGSVVTRVTAAEPDEPSDASEESEAAATTTTAAPGTTVVTATLAEEAAPAPSQPNRVGEPAGLPIRSPGDVAAGWVAQISSVPASVGGDGLTSSFDAVRRTVPDAIIVRGSEWPGLRAGFWVIVRAGFDDAAATVAGCDGWGFVGRDECFARHLSADDGAQRTCWRDDSGALAGTCS